MRLAVAVVLAVCGGLLAWSPWGGGTQRIEAVFDGAQGLVEGAEVRAGGLQVGSVARVRLVDGLPRVTLELRDGFRLRRGATADLRLGSLSGTANRVVSVTEGDGPVLPDGAVLGRAVTDQPVEVEDVLGALDPRTRREARALLRGLRTTLDDRGADVAVALRRAARALRGMSGVLAEVTADGPALRELVTASRRVTGALAARPGATGEAVAQTAAVLSDAAAEAGALRDGVRTLPAALREPRTALARLRGDVPLLRATVRDAAPAVTQLRGAAPELRAALRTGALGEARRLVAGLPEDLRRLRPLLPAARRTAGVLAPVLREAAPVLDETRVRLPDVFSFFANWADFTANYDANGHAARVSLVLPPAPLSPSSPDGTEPGHLPAPFVRTPGAAEGEPWKDFRDSFLGAGG